MGKVLVLPVVEMDHPRATEPRDVLVKYGQRIHSLELDVATRFADRFLIWLWSEGFTVTEVKPDEEAE